MIVQEFATSLKLGQKLVGIIANDEQVDFDLQHADQDVQRGATAQRFRQPFASAQIIGLTAEVRACLAHILRRFGAQLLADLTPIGALRIVQLAMDAGLMNAGLTQKNHVITSLVYTIERVYLPQNHLER